MRGRKPGRPCSHPIEWLIAMLYADGQNTIQISMQIGRSRNFVQDQIRAIKLDFIAAGLRCYTQSDVRKCMVSTGHLKEVTHG